VTQVDTNIVLSLLSFNKGAFHLVTQVDTNIVLFFLAFKRSTKTQYLCQLVSPHGKHSK